MAARITKKVSRYRLTGQDLVSTSTKKLRPYGRISHTTASNFAFQMAESPTTRERYSKLICSKLAIGAGYFIPISSSVSRRISDTARFRYQFRFAGITYQGA